ncbi:hypothetical protein D3C78_1686880 [compost metagenome]
MGGQHKGVFITRGDQAVIVITGRNRRDDGFGITVLTAARIVPLQRLRRLGQQADYGGALRLSDVLRVTGVSNAGQNADDGHDNQQFDQCEALVSYCCK